MRPAGNQLVQNNFAVVGFGLINYAQQDLAPFLAPGTIFCLGQLPSVYTWKKNVSITFFQTTCIRADMRHQSRLGGGKSQDDPVFGKQL